MPGQDGETGAAVDISIDGSRPVRWPIGHDWTSIAVDLPYTPSMVQARRINMRSSRVQSLADGRTVGVQIGPPRVIAP
jgi:hypothetical protein